MSRARATQFHRLPPGRNPSVESAVARSSHPTDRRSASAARCARQGDRPTSSSPHRNTRHRTRFSAGIANWSRRSGLAETMARPTRRAARDSRARSPHGVLELQVGLYADSGSASEWVIVWLGLQSPDPEERHLRRAIREYVAHYHHERNHQGLDNALAPSRSSQQAWPSESPLR